MQFQSQTQITDIHTQITKSFETPRLDYPNT